MIVRRLLSSALILAVAGSAWLANGQANAQNRRQKQTPQQAAAQMEKKKKAKQTEDAYRASLRAIPDKTSKPDPWNGMR